MDISLDLWGGHSHRTDERKCRGFMVCVCFGRREGLGMVFVRRVRVGMGRVKVKGGSLIFSIGCILFIGMWIG
jgi:hypothetical protein